MTLTATPALARLAAHVFLPTMHNGAADLSSVSAGKLIAFCLVGLVLAVAFLALLWQLCRCARDARAMMGDPDLAAVLSAPARGLADDRWSNDDLERALRVPPPPAPPPPPDALIITG